MRELRNQKNNPLFSLIIIICIGIFFLVGTLVRVIEKDFMSLLVFAPTCFMLLIMSLFIGQKIAGIEQKRRKLIKAGKCFDAQVMDVAYDKTIKCKPLANGISWNPLVITVRYIDENGIERIEKSECLYHQLSDDVNKFSSKVWTSDDDIKEVYVQIFYHDNK